MAQEVEIKFRASDEQMKILESFLDDSAVFLKEVHHKEHYLDKSRDSFTFTSEQWYKDAHTYLRVRFTELLENGTTKASVCLKDWKIDEKASKVSDHVIHSHCDEHETNVEDGKEMLNLFRQLGYDREVLVDKKRCIYEYKDLEIVIDDVKDLGVFVEVELKWFYKDIDDAKRQIFSFLKKLWFEQINEWTRGYISMFWNPDVEFGEMIEL